MIEKESKSRRKRERVQERESSRESSRQREREREFKREFKSSREQTLFIVAKREIDGVDEGYVSLEKSFDGFKDAKDSVLVIKRATSLIWGSDVRDQRSEIRDQGKRSEIRDQRKRSRD